jgi:ABC-2 type transport system permease protein
MPAETRRTGTRRTGTSRAEQVHRIGALVRHNLALALRDPGPLLSRLVMPLVAVTVVRPLYQSATKTGDGTAQAVAGILVMFSLLGISVVGNAILSERIWRTVDRLRATPAAPVELLAGKALPGLLLFLLQQGVLLGYGVLALGLRVAGPGLLAVVVLGWAVALLGCGAMLATLARNTSELSAATDIGGLILTCLGGALVPLELLPDWARAIAPASPGYWAMRGLRAAFTGDRAAALGSTGVLVAVAAVAAGVAGYRLARGWGRGTP